MRITHKIGHFILEYYPIIDKYKLVFYDKTDYWTNSFKIIKRELMDKNFTIYNTEGFIKSYFDGNITRFLRKHKRQYYYQLTYSVTFKKWKKKKESRRAVKAIINSCDNLPGEVNQVANILLTLEDYYGWEVNKDNAIIASKIWFAFHNRIRLYYQSRGSKKSLPTTKQAIKEQKARGFVKRKHFDDYDGEYVHIESIADRRLIYPHNILSIPIRKSALLKSQKTGIKNILFNPIYKGIGSIGVTGHTRITQFEK